MEPVNSIRSVSYPFEIQGEDVSSLSIRVTSLSDDNITPLFPRKKFSSEAINTLITSAETSLDDIEEAFQSFDDERGFNVKGLKTTLNDNLQKALNKITSSNDFRENTKNKFDLVKDFFKDQLDLINTYFAEPYSRIFSVFPFKGSEKPQVFIKPVGYARSAIATVGTLSLGVFLFVQLIQYNQAKSILSQFKKELEQDPKNEDILLKIQVLRGFLKLQKEQMKEKLKMCSIGFGTSAIVTLLALKKYIDPVAPALTKTLGFVAPFIRVFMSTLSHVKLSKQKNVFKTWIEKGLFQDGQDLLLKRQTRLILKKLSSEEFNERLKDSSIPQICNELYPKVYDEDGKRLLSAEEKSQTMSVSVRNALKVLVEKKSKMEKKAFNFTFLISKLNLSFVSLQAAIATILTILTLTGVIALSASLMAIPALGFFVLGLVLTAAGIIYLRNKRPNIFNAYVKGVYVKLFFANIAAKIRTLQASRKILKRHRLENKNLRLTQLNDYLEKQNSLKNLQIPKDLQGVFNQLKISIEKKIKDFSYLKEDAQKEQMLDNLKNLIDKQDKKLSKSIVEEQKAIKKRDYWTFDEAETEDKDGVITKLKDRLRHAAYQDFLKNNSDIQVVDINGSFVITDIIVEAIIKEKLYLDNELTTFLSEKMGINFNEMTDLDETVMKKKIRRLLEDYMLKDEQAFTKIIQKALTPPP